MGDYDSEIYNMLHYSYNELIAIHELLKDLNHNVKSMADEVRGLRDEMKRGTG